MRCQASRSSDRRHSDSTSDDAESGAVSAGSDPCREVEQADTSCRERCGLKRLFECARPCLTTIYTTIITGFSISVLNAPISSAPSAPSTAR